MNLFIDPISSPAKIFLYDENKNILDQNELIIKGNESSHLLEFITDFLEKNNFKSKDLKNIVLVRGPGSFTGVRTAVLIINSLAFINKTKLTAISYFDLFKNYPIVKTSSKRDCFIKFSEESEIINMPNNEVLELAKSNKFYGDYTDIDDIFVNIDYISIINEIKFDNLEKIEPLYIKKPNIF